MDWTDQEWVGTYFSGAVAVGLVWEDVVGLAWVDVVGMAWVDMVFTLRRSQRMDMASPRGYDIHLRGAKRGEWRQSSTSPEPLAR